MIYREFPYMQSAKALEEQCPPEAGYIRLCANQPPAPTLDELGINPLEVDFNLTTPYTSETVKRTLAAHYCVDPDAVMAVPGGSSFANFLAAALFIQPGTEVIVETPVYDALPGCAELLGATVRFLSRDPHHKYGINLDELSRLKTGRTSLVMLTNPHNPSGIALDSETLKNLADFSHRHRTPVLVDEVYLDHVPHSKPASAYGEGLIHTSSVTKVYGIASWRFGWLIATNEIREQCERLYDLMGVLSPGPVNGLAEKLLPRLSQLRSSIQGKYIEGAEMVDRFVKKHSLWWRKPEHCPFGFIKLPDGVDDRALFNELKEKHKVIVACGSSFRSPGWIRINWILPREALEKGLAAIAAALAR